MLKSSRNNHLKKGYAAIMTELPVKPKFDFIFSNFDGVNYILEQKIAFRII